MRTLLFLAAAILLAGCGADTDEPYWGPYHDSSDGGQTAAVQQPVAAQQTDASQQTGMPQQTDAAPAAEVPDIDAYCRGVAHRRALDARANGYDPDIEKTIYQGTLKDCVDWRTQHAG